MRVGNSFSGNAALEAVKGTPAVVMAAWTMNDVLVAISIVYVLFQCAYLAWKWHRELKNRNAEATD